MLRLQLNAALAPALHPNLAPHAGQNRDPWDMKRNLIFRSFPALLHAWKPYKQRVLDCLGRSKSSKNFWVGW